MTLKVLFIGGTGNISTPVSELAIARGIDLYLLNRGNRPVSIDGVTSLMGDIRDRASVEKAIGKHTFDVVVNWIAFTPDQVQQDIDVFGGRTGQYIFISSASAYQKPLRDQFVTESTPLANPYWQYSRNKIACEELLMHAYRDSGFPATIVRPSHTYDTIVPLPVSNGYTGFHRLKTGKPFIVHGDGKTLWTLTHCIDFAKGFVPLMGHPATMGQAYHITSDEALTWDDIVHHTAAALGVEANIIHIPSEVIAKNMPGTGDGLLGDKAWCAQFDNSKVKALVPDFVCTIPFHEGIKSTVAWFDADSERQVVNEVHDAAMDALVEKFSVML